MRKHRLSGVVIAVLIGLSTFTHRSDFPHRTPGTDRAGIQLASVRFPAGQAVAAVQVTAAVQGTDELHVGLLHQLGGRSAANLSSPLGPEVLVQDLGPVQMVERAQAEAFLAVVARNQAAARAYLAALPRPAPHPAPPRPAVRPTVPAPATAPRVATAPAGRDPFAALRQCESGGNYGTDTSNGYYGAYQFTVGTWRSLGFGGLPSQAPPVEQDKAAHELQARRGWGQWPSCSRRLGLI